MFLGAFVEAVPQIKLLTFDVQAGVYPIELEECDGYLITGSSYSVNDDHEWILEVKEFIRECNDLNVKLAGVCFGHQIIADALGGKVEQSAKGWGLGVQTAKITNAAEWMKPSLDAFKTFYSHQDQVVSLPPTAQLHASCEHCENAMYSIGKHIISLQGHPEFTIDYAYALACENSEMMTKGEFEASRETFSHDVSNDTLMRWIYNFFKISDEES